ncbi:hypothetical protein JW826_04520 [Candidatus Woesearchaeota archaeon]|nr:hypothetical protein [Candidatus Woesearchaeota archaeon]
MSDNEIDFLEYLDALKENWIAATVAFLVVFGLVLAYTLTTTPMYESRSLVFVASQDQASFLLGNAAPKTISDLETQKIILQSTSVLGPIYAEHPIDSFELKVNTIKNSNILEIVVTSDSALNAMNIANKISESYESYNKDLRKDEANEVITFISEQIDLYNLEGETLSARKVYYDSLGENITNEQALEYETLKREINAKNKIYDYLLNKREEANLVVSLRSGNVRILSRAELPIAPVRPNVPLNIALGLILAAGAAIGAAYAAKTIMPPQNGKKKKLFNW